MNVEFIKLSPTKNITLLVTSSVPYNIQTSVASELMRLDSDAEQVGFLESPFADGARARLQMMGGEFCGNAAMAAGAYLASLDKLVDGQKETIPLEVSGTDTLVKCTITSKGGCFEGTVLMPLPRSVEKRTLRFNEKIYDAQCVDMRGILHIILPFGSFENDSLAEAALMEWSRLFKSDAFGLILFNESNNSIKPLVYVPSAGSLVWERGCGSGSAAVGCCLAVRSDGSICVLISQPGGIITVHACAENGVVTELMITGNVYIVGEPQRADIEL